MIDTAIRDRVFAKLGNRNEQEKSANRIKKFKYLFFTNIFNKNFFELKNTKGKRNTKRDDIKRATFLPPPIKDIAFNGSGVL